ncbi:MAG: hypothetical protein A2046_02905 [Bacteroidetes bacterium GWA2_30_7]|nr:MAG: hypothetical protein A2046_02905 [Bacteroidetes bacterium GWA2_30_7]
MYNKLEFKLIFMKTKFTLLKLYLIIIIYFSIIYNALSQTKYIVNVSNYSFSPSTLTILAGDTVEWHNISGNHNVNGTTGTFPSNPASFGNLAGTGWTYSYVFNTVGSYEYQCNIHPSMKGYITVNAAAIASSVFENKFLSFYPNPCSKILNINYNLHNNIAVKIYNITGTLVLSKQIDLNDNTIDIESIPMGLYIVQFLEDNKIVFSRKLIKE